MKIRTYILTAIAATVLLSSCEKVLDEKPVVELADEVALTSTAGLEAALIGAYHKLQHGDLYGGRFWVSPDMIAGSVKISGRQNTVFEELQMLNKTMSGQSNRIVEATWGECYKAIHIANKVIQFLDIVNDEEMTEDVAQRIEGEALFIRALLSFEMTRLYSYDVTGHGPLSVPILTEPLTPFDTPPRNTVEEAYDQIVQDLENAAVLLEGKVTERRATDVAAMALLSRVNFYREDWPGVITAADYVIGKFAGQANGGLADDVIDCFTLESLPQEVLFAVLSSATDDASGTLRSYYRLASNAKFSIPISYLLKIGVHVSENDARSRVDHALVNVDGQVYSTKFDVDYLNVPVIRLAEVYLNRAEALVHQNQADLAAADLNVVRERSGAGSYTAPATLADCETERTVELYYEGDYLHNMKRLKKTDFAVDINGNKYSWDDVRLVFPIPHREINVNPNLLHNR